MDIDWDNIECYVCCNHCDTLEFGEAPVTGVYIFAIRIHETIRLLTFSFFVGDEITLDADLLNEDSVSQITVYYMDGEEGVIVHQCNINVSISSSVPNPCPLPDFVPDCPDCGDADYELTLDGEVVGIGSIPCNETTSIAIDGLCPVGDDATFDLTLNGDIVGSGSIPCGTNDVIPIDAFIPTCEDANYSVEDSAANVLDSGTIPSGGSQTVVVTDSTVNITDSTPTLLYAKTVLAQATTSQVITDSVANLKDSAGTAISTTNIKAQASANITAPDATSTINGSALPNIVSGGVGTFLLRDYLNNSLPIISVVGSTIKAKPAFDARNLSSFLVLNWNNPFGNTNRFTDTLGTQLYANGIVLDWSQYRQNAQSVLGYLDNATLYSGTYANALTHYAGLTQGGLSVWRMGTFPDMGVLVTDVNYLNYAPFNYNLATAATSIRVNTSILANHWQFTNAGVATATQAINRLNLGVRDITLTELGL